MKRAALQVRWTLLALAGIGLSLAAVALVGSLLEPRHEGITATEWVQRLARDSTIARPALLAMGRRASPALARAVSYHPSRIVEFLNGQRSIVPFFVRRRLPNRHAAELIRMRAIEILHEMGTNAAPAAGALLRLDTPDQVDAFSYGGLAEATLARIGAAALPQLQRALRDPSAAVRARAASSLGRIGPAAAPALTSLRRCLRDPDRKVQRETIAAIAAIGSAARPALADLRPLLARAPDEIRFEAADAWWRVGGDAATLLPLLVSTLEDRGNPSRARAATLLGQLGPAAQPAVPALQRVLKEEFSYTRVKAAEALERIEPARDGSTAAP